MGQLSRGTWMEKPDFTKVDEVGFADLLPGSGHGWGGFSTLAGLKCTAGRCHVDRSAIEGASPKKRGEMSAAAMDCRRLTDGVRYENGDNHGVFQGPGRNPAANARKTSLDVWRSPSDQRNL